MSPRRQRVAVVTVGPTMLRGVGIRRPTGKILALNFTTGHKSCLFAFYANGLQFVSIVYADWHHTDHEATTVWSAEKMQSLLRDELAYRQSTKCRGYLIACPSALIGVTLAAALSIALIGNVLVACLNG